MYSPQNNFLGVKGLIFTHLWILPLWIWTLKFSNKTTKTVELFLGQGQLVQSLSEMLSCFLSGPRWGPARLQLFLDKWTFSSAVVTDSKRILSTPVKVCSCCFQKSLFKVSKKTLNQTEQVLKNNDCVLDLSTLKFTYLLEGKWEVWKPPCLAWTLAQLLLAGDLE